MGSEMVKDYGLVHVYKHNLIPIKGNLLIKKNKDMESLHGKIKVNILGIFIMIKDMDMGKCIGLMEMYIKVNGKMGNKFHRYNKQDKYNKYNKNYTININTVDKDNNNNNCKDNNN